MRTAQQAGANGLHLHPAAEVLHERMQALGEAGVGVCLRAGLAAVALVGPWGGRCGAPHILEAGVAYLGRPLTANNRGQRRLQQHQLAWPGTWL